MARHRTLRQVFQDPDSTDAQIWAALGCLALYIVVGLAAWVAVIAFAFRTHPVLGLMTIALPAIGVHYTVTKERR